MTYHQLLRSWSPQSPFDYLTCSFFHISQNCCDKFLTCWLPDESSYAPPRAVSLYLPFLLKVSLVSSPNYPLFMLYVCILLHQKYLWPSLRCNLLIFQNFACILFSPQSLQTLLGLDSKLTSSIFPTLNSCFLGMFANVFNFWSASLPQVGHFDLHVWYATLSCR